MTCVRIQTDQTEPITVLIVDANGDALPGKSDIKIKIRRLSDGLYFDWDDNEFKTPGAITQLLETLDPVSDSYSPGEYHLSTTDHPDGFDTSKIVNAADDDVYYITAIQDGGTDAANVPQIGEIKEGDFLDFIDQKISDNATPDEVKWALREYGLDHLVSVNPGVVPPATGTYIRQILDKLDEIDTGGNQYWVQQSYSFDPTADELTGQVWVESNNLIEASAASVSVTWYDDDGTAAFTMTDSSPDAQGVFKVEQASPGLVKHRSYYAVATVTITGFGSVVGAKGAFTLG